MHFVYQFDHFCDTSGFFEHGNGISVSVTLGTCIPSNQRQIIQDGIRTMKSVSQSISQSVRQSVFRSVGWSVGQSEVNEWVSESVRSQPVSQSVSQSVSLSVSDLIEAMKNNNNSSKVNLTHATK